MGIGIFLLSMLPVVALLLYVYECDSYKPEPWSVIVRGLFYGAASVLLTWVFLCLIEMLGLDFDEQPTVMGQFIGSFVSAAIPEELSKLIMLLLLMRKNPYFDEHIDGIVYAASVGLGFAAVENLAYVAMDDDWVSTALMRAVTAVPGHFLDAVAMGYFYSLYRFDVDGKKTRWMWLMILVPILFHGIYDALLFVSDVTGELMSCVLILLFLFWMNRMRKFAKTKIAELKEKDKSDLNGGVA